MLILLEKEAEAAKFCSDPNNAQICDECLKVAEEIFANQEGHSFPPTRMGPQCSFCLENDEEAKYLVDGPAVYICDACVNDLRQKII